jgi:hypothetical protein
MCPSNTAFTSSRPPQGSAFHGDDVKWHSGATSGAKADGATRGRATPILSGEERLSVKDGFLED